MYDILMHQNLIGGIGKVPSPSSRLLCQPLNASAVRAIFPRFSAAYFMSLSITDQIRSIAMNVIQMNEFSIYLCRFTIYQLMFDIAL